MAILSPAYHRTLLSNRQSGGAAGTFLAGTIVDESLVGQWIMRAYAANG